MLKAKNSMVFKRSFPMIVIVFLFLIYSVKLRIDLLFKGSLAILEGGDIVQIGS